MFSTLSRKMGFSKKSMLFDGQKSNYILHFEIADDELEGKYKKAYQITGFEKVNKSGEIIFGKKGKDLKEVDIFMDKFIDIDLSILEDNWFDRYILLIGKKRGAIESNEIDIQNEFSRYELAPKIIYHDSNVKGKPILIIEKCAYDLYDFISNTQQCSEELLNKVIELYQFPEELEYIYLDVKPENMIVCRNNPDEDFYLRLIDFGKSYIIDFSKMKYKKNIRILGNKIMLATFLINTLKFFKICAEFCQEMSSYLNDFIKPSDWEDIT